MPADRQDSSEEFDGNALQASPGTTVVNAAGASGGRLRESAVNLLALFGSSGTLICCALPIVLVTLGLGSVVVGLTGAAPWLMTLAKHKLWVLLLSALLLAGSGWVLYRPGRSCPADPVLARRCERIDRFNRRVFWLSVVLWLVGFVTAWLALPLARLFD